ncbi:MAG TPA: family 10 glycosylhydrolase [Gemmatimonas sp.]|nr:family 10 glycosylhydrolase [Gemmatimonas sp.]
MQPSVQSTNGARRLSLACALAFLLVTACNGESPAGPGTPPVTPPPPTALIVPPIAREFRGLWIATVANIDWPSRTGLTPAAAQAELLAILDRARDVGLNAVILQVRASGDAMYSSTLEPWSRALTGTQGSDPGWDPLAFAVDAAHQRGLELHAWFNPFRGGNAGDTVRLAPTHLGRRSPSVVRLYCGALWFDPASPVVQNQAINVVKDVIARYDVDAVHIDDFFYPYPTTACPGLDFPDGAEFDAYRAGGGALARADWRRDNVNRFVERLYAESHASRATIRVGISPFGIWRPGNPPGIVGLDSYASIYADSRLWLQRGWADYLAPQLYWSIASTGQSFNALTDWWTAQNSMRRHLWPGLAAYRVADGTTSAYAAGEIVAQVSALRQRAGGAGGPTGAVLYNTSSVMSNRDGLLTALTATFAARALVPATPWLDAVVPQPPTMSVSSASAAGAPVLRVAISGDGGEPLSWWLLRWRNATGWSQRLVPVSTRTVDVPAGAGAAATDAIVLNAIDRTGNASSDVIWRTVQ